MTHLATSDESRTNSRTGFAVISVLVARFAYISAHVRNVVNKVDGYLVDVGDDLETGSWVGGYWLNGTDWVLHAPCFWVTGSKAGLWYSTFNARLGTDTDFRCINSWQLIKQGGKQQGRVFSAIFELRLARMVLLNNVFCGIEYIQTSAIDFMSHISNRNCLSGCAVCIFTCLFFMVLFWWDDNSFSAQLFWQHEKIIFWFAESLHRATWSTKKWLLWWCYPLIVLSASCPLFGFVWEGGELRRYLSL